MPATCAEHVLDAIEKACASSALEEDESEPYKHKYEAADLLRKVLGERSVLGAEPKPSAAVGDAAASAAPHEANGSSDAGPAADPVGAAPRPAPEFELAAAAARIRCGLILLETDLLPDGESSIVAGLPQLEKSPDAFLAWLLEAYNALGALYSSRGELPTALSWLQRAESLYQGLTATGTRHAHLALPIAGLAPPAAPPVEAPSEAAGQAAGEAASAAPGSGAQGPQAEALGQGEVAAPADAQGRQDGAQESGDPAAAPGQPGTDATGGAAPAAPPEPGAPAEGEAAPAEGEAAPAEGEAAPAEGAVGSGPSATEPDPAMAADANGAAAASSEPPSRAGSEGAPAAGAAASVAPAEPAAGADGAAPSSAPAPASLSASPSTTLPRLHLPANDNDAVQEQYTRTLYYLAQVYGHMKVADRSALYCAATLYRQLASGKYELDTWVNNCLQLGGYYAKVHAYGLAMYCHAAAQAVVDRDTAAGRSLGEDVAANVKLATARLHAMRLSASHSMHIEGKDLEVHYPDVSYFPDYLRFPGLQLAAPDSFPWGREALAKDFDGARELFNTAMPYFKDALSYYQLDGFVTDHVGILMDMSNMYRCLASFESDPSRVAAMQRCRCQLLEPLSGQLNPQFYPGLSRSIDLELAHVYREVSDVRERQGGQAAKTASAAASAVKYYQRFLRSFATSEGGDLPDRIDTDNEPYFLMASFGLGRMLHRMKGGASGAPADPSYAQLVVSAHKHLQWTAAYVKRHALEAWTEEAQAAEELSELLVERMRLHALAASRKAAGR
ncbi:hypothetical protein GPECTOR_33g608 [Gonium pectorale]|uniref:KIF-binding protein n=1 Tax=Gonium pectorale TaxID=33097 RepID=A0A150GD13_GONPE|nr:hypothetical protein GPECTOR_33g608 [Gonium pectorale]|eukprot:KXZ47726.1 hypothetical protein GPECTOR_33g608 [Gonium pectorale]